MTISSRTVVSSFVFLTPITIPWGAKKEKIEELSKKSIRLEKTLVNVLGSILTKDIKVETYRWSTFAEDEYGWEVETFGIEVVITYTHQCPLVDPQEHKLGVLMTLLTKRYNLRMVSAESETF